nr:helix-turn-helix domain-containing protein [Agromyces seonyuensis]
MPQLVNHVAQAVGRPAVLEDRRHRMVAYSPQDGVIDDVRRNSILRHLADPAVRSWLDRIGAYRADHAMHIPENRELGMLPRLVVPIRRADTDADLGHLWFIESPSAMDEAAVARADEYAGRIADEWTRSTRLLDADAAQAGAQASTLVFGTEKRRAGAAARLLAERRIRPADGVRILVLRAAFDSASPHSSPARAALERTIRAATGALGIPSVLAFPRKSQAIFVVPAGGPALADGIQDAAERLLGIGEVSFAGILGADRIDVGVGGPAALLAGARDSYVQARRAIRIATEFGLARGVQRWDGLGPYRGLGSIAERGLRSADFQHGLERVAAERDGAALLETVEVYLGTGGRAQESAAALNLHRSSLYHRLGRVERILDLDLQDGVERLGLHIAILLAKLERGAEH